MKIEMSTQEITDAVNALRAKASGDREAAGTLDPAAPAGVQSLSKTLLAQANREDKLADRLEDEGY